MMLALSLSGIGAWIGRLSPWWRGPGGCVVDRTAVSLKFDGEQAKGSMDVEQIGPALVGLARAVQSATKRLNGDRTNVVVRISEDTDSGSFEVHLDWVDLEVAAGGVFLTLQAVTLDQIQESLFGEGGVMDRVTAWWSRLRATAPEATPSSIATKGGMSPVSTVGDATSSTVNQTTNITNITNILVADAATLRGLRDMTAPLEARGIEDLVITNKKSKKRYKARRREDAEALRAAVPEGADAKAETTYTADVTATRVAFTPRKRWSFVKDGKTKDWDATVSDPEFLKQIEEKSWIPEKGDRYRVEVRDEVFLGSKGRQRHRRTVLRVVTKDHVKDNQHRLFEGAE